MLAARRSRASPIRHAMPLALRGGKSRRLRRSRRGTRTRVLATAMRPLTPPPDTSSFNLSAAYRFALAGWRLAAWRLAGWRLAGWRLAGWRVACGLDPVMAANTFVPMGLPTPVQGSQPTRAE
jgi:hypothetical protein